MDDSSTTNKTTVLCFGDVSNFKILFKKINDQFKSNQKFLNSKNVLEIIEAESNNHILKINTKYYDLLVNLELIQINSNDNDFKLKIENLNSNYSFIQGIFMLVDKNNLFCLNLVENLFKKFYENEDSTYLSILMTCDELDVETNEEIKSFLDKYQDFVGLNLNLKQELESNSSEEDFSDFEELINSIFVHNWEGIKLKSDKQAQVKPSIAQQAKIENSNKTDVAEQELNENEFNIENLLMNLKEMREKATNMNFEDRKKYAENVAINFWKSIGGDLGEIDDLCDDED